MEWTSSSDSTINSRYVIIMIHEHDNDDNVQNDSGRGLKWGDEVEYIIVKLDHENKKARVSLRAATLLDQLTKPEENMKKMENPDMKLLPSLWRPEYASYMVEGTPGYPYGGSLNFFNTVEHNMRARRQELEQLLEEDEHCFSISSFPRLGCPDFTSPPTLPDPVHSFTR